jgi:hypothetical protein
MLWFWIWRAIAYEAGYTRLSKTTCDMPSRATMVKNYSIELARIAQVPGWREKLNKGANT